MSSADSNAAIQKCIKRVEKAGCQLSGNNEDRIAQNVLKCRHMESESGKTDLELFLLDKSDKLVVIKTKGSGVSKPDCPTTKFTVDSSGLKDMKIVDNKVFMISNDGQVYIMHSDETVYELLNSEGEHYTSVSEIEGSGDGESITLKFKHGGKPRTLRHEDIQKRIEQGKMRQLDFFRVNTARSVFRDE